jgi:hypothetical protein
MFLSLLWIKKASQIFKMPFSKVNSQFIQFFEKCEFRLEKSFHAKDTALTEDLILIIFECDVEVYVALACRSKHAFQVDEINTLVLDSSARIICMETVQAVRTKRY